jgi:hypothetical protein
VTSIHTTLPVSHQALRTTGAKKEEAAKDNFRQVRQVFPQQSRSATPWSQPVLYTEQMTNDVHVHFNYSVTSYHSVLTFHSIHTQSIRISQHITTHITRTIPAERRPYSSLRFVDSLGEVLRALV